METLPYGHPTLPKKGNSKTLQQPSDDRLSAQMGDARSGCWRAPEGRAEVLTSWDSWDRLFRERPRERRHHPPGQIW